MEAQLCPNEPEVDVLYQSKDDEVCDYFEWCASFLSSAPREGNNVPTYSSASSTCSSGPPSERSTPNVSPYSTPEQYPPPSPENAPMQYSFEAYQEEAPRIVVPQVFQTINIGVVQQYPGGPHAHHQLQNLLQHSQQVLMPTAHHHVQNALTHSSSALQPMESKCKELLVIEHGKEMQKRKAVALEVATVGIELPEFAFNEMNGEDSKVTLRPSFQLSQAFYRNCYELLRMKMPPSPSMGNFEGYRVYVTPKLGYSGNAKRFKQGPDAGEKAFVLDGEILNQNMEPIVQCQACEEYFRDASRRILLIKNNVPIHIRSGEFQLQLKLMCCSSHHHTPFFFHFTLNDHMSKRVVMSSIFSVNVKQWKNMGSSGNKKRKTEDSR